VSNPLIVFTYAPAGLGHIRVANALMSDVPAGLEYLIFAPSDKTTETTHRFTSLNVPARHVMEFFQQGAPRFYLQNSIPDTLRDTPEIWPNSL